MSPSPLLPLALLLCLLASTAHPAPASQTYNAESKTGLSKVSGYSGEGSAAVDPASASGDSEEEEESTAVGEHKIRVRDAAPIRFWSGSRYGRSGRSAGGNSESQSHGGGSTVGMAMSLRSSGPVIQPRHDRFFLGSRYGKRAPGPRGAAVLAQWRRSEEENADEGEETEDGEEQGQQDEQEVRGQQEEMARAVKEALRLRALPRDSEEVFGVASQRLSSAIQPAACIYMGIGNLYRCYEGRRGGGMH
ncbi:uncharacterized protein LOC124169586 [Ischnura elegans]|uniref:uncharacterized protein LOC124169586 n=1 Tax=Ischnura elegans TaxID=197161 RepID=UPI001ED8B1BE|nr:uncharacterized protein LOC124169586 [Ischnura elegans]